MLGTLDGWIDECDDLETRAEFAIVSASREDQMFSRGEGRIYCDQTNRQVRRFLGHVLLEAERVVPRALIGACGKYVSCMEGERNQTMRIVSFRLREYTERERTEHDIPCADVDNIEVACSGRVMYPGVARPCEMEGEILLKALDVHTDRCDERSESSKQVRRGGITDLSIRMSLEGSIDSLREPRRDDILRSDGRRCGRENDICGEAGRGR